MQDFDQEIKKALAGSRKMRIKFKREAVDDVMYLCGMERGGIVRIDDTTALVLSAVMASRSWSLDENRIVNLTLGENFDPKWFRGRMKDALEEIEAVEA
ncbi:MAG: hypothetical protein NTX82_04590 [Candidatus Parcubacteria bacterium]|nr:hypothetical protein [Candidatus Parcubacteria bacterium]